MSKIDTSKTSWDLSRILLEDNDQIFEEEKTRAIVENYEFINTWKDRNEYLSDPLVLKLALDELEALETQTGSTGNLSYYYSLTSALDQTNPHTLSRLNKIEEFGIKIANDREFFMHRLAQVDSKTQTLFLASEDLKEYHHLLKNLFENAKYQLTEAEEKILNVKATVSHDNWVHMTESILSKEEREVVTEDGNAETKSFSEILSLTNNKNKFVRDSAAKACNEVQERWVDVAENEINSILQNKRVNDELRGMARPDLLRHINDDMDSSVVDSLIDTVTNNFDIAKEFYKVKAKALGQKKLAYHERNVEVGDIKGEFNFDQSVHLVYKVFSDIDTEFGEIFKGFVENGHIDAFPRKGKQGGAFCSHDLKTEPTYILLNHTNKLPDVLTLAHEAGHGINNELMREQNSLYFDSPLSTAEVASTFFEDFVLDELARFVDAKTAYAIKMQKLNDDVGTIIRQVACYNFETELHREFRRVGYLSKGQIGEIFSKHMSAYMGDWVEKTPGCENWWVYWGHIRSFFYVYSYASGLLISKALQKMVRHDRSNIHKVKIFLRYGRSKSPKDIFTELGIDISAREFWQSGLDSVKNELGEVAKVS